MIFKKIFRIILTIIGGTLGAVILYVVDSNQIIAFQKNEIRISAYIAAALTLAIIFYVISNYLLHFGRATVDKAELNFRQIPGIDLVLGTIGLIIGLIVSYLVTLPLSILKIHPILTVLVSFLTVIIYFALSYFGIKLAIKKKEEIVVSFGKIFSSNKEKSSKKYHQNENKKILDTSTIIDGRIADIIKAGFVEGTIIIPIFVLEELQHIADSENNLRRQKGRRGLDVLKLIQEECKDRVVVDNEKYDSIPEVDSKILELASHLNAKVITNDYNLNKVAAVRKINVLNINELANALKPVVIPGEDMYVKVLKAGKEQNQGLGYLDDGTMIVVEEGENLIGQDIEAIVTSVIQTAAGKMIFVKPK